jgi:hypothetical protein
MKVVICGGGIPSDVAYPIDEVSVGADGVHSTVRRLVFGDESKFLRYLGFHTAAFVFDPRQARRNRGPVRSHRHRWQANGVLPCATAHRCFRGALDAGSGVAERHPRCRAE